jgi:hypothetical protein
MEDQVGGEHQATQEAEAGGALQEVGQQGIKAGVLSAAQPVAEGGAGDASLVGAGALGAVGGVSVVEVVQGLGGVGAVPAERVWRGVSVGVRLGRSHGSSPWVVFCGKDTVGSRAMLVQGARPRASGRQGTSEQYSAPDRLLLDQSTIRAGLIKLRDPDDNLWNADQLFILTAKREQAVQLARLIEEEDWGGEKPTVYDDQAEIDSALGVGRQEYGLLSIWWD